MTRAPLLISLICCVIIACAASGGVNLQDFPAHLGYQEFSSSKPGYASSTTILRNTESMSPVDRMQAIHDRSTKSRAGAFDFFPEFKGAVKPDTPLHFKGNSLTSICSFLTRSRLMLWNWKFGGNHERHSDCTWFVFAISDQPVHGVLLVGKSTTVRFTNSETLILTPCDCV